MDPPRLALSDDWAAVDPLDHDRIDIPGGAVEVLTQLHRDLRVCASDTDAPPWRFIAAASIAPTGALAAPRVITPVVRRAAVARFRKMLTARGFESLVDAGEPTVELSDVQTPVRRLRARVRIHGTEHPAVAMMAVLPAGDGWHALAGASVLDLPDDPVPPAAVPGELLSALSTLSR